MQSSRNSHAVMPRCQHAKWHPSHAEGGRGLTSFATLSEEQPYSPPSRADSPFTAQLKSLPSLQASEGICCLEHAP